MSSQLSTSSSVKGLMTPMSGRELKITHDIVELREELVNLKNYSVPNPTDIGTELTKLHQMVDARSTSVVELLNSNQARAEKAQATSEALLTQLAECQASMQNLMVEQNQLLKALCVGLKAHQYEGLLQPQASGDSGSEASTHKSTSLCESPSNSVMPVYLRMKIDDKVRRVKLQEDCREVLTYAQVCRAIENTFPQLGDSYILKYRDDSKDLCRLQEDSLADFMGFVKEMAGAKVLTIEIFESDSEVIAPSQVQERKSVAIRPPNLFWSMVDIFTMGFSVSRISILEIDGPVVLTDRLRTETADLAMINTLLFTVVFDVWESTITGSFETHLQRDTASDGSMSWQYRAFYILVVIGVCFNSVAMLTTVLLGMMLNNLLDEHVVTFMKLNKINLKVPYLTTIYGLISLLAACALLAFCASTWEGIVTASACAIGFIVVLTAGGRYIEAAIIADVELEDKS